MEMKRRTLLSFLAMAPFGKAALPKAPVPLFTSGGLVGATVGAQVGYIRSEVPVIAAQGEAVLSRQVVEAIQKAFRNNQEGMRTRLLNQLNRT